MSLFSSSLSPAAAATSFPARRSAAFSRRPSSVRPISAFAAAPPRPLATSCLRSPYEVLGLSPAATAPEIKAAYRRLALACHPDVAGAGSSDEFRRVHEAYATLSDPLARAAYDRSAAPPRRRGARRTWETEQCW